MSAKPLETDQNSNSEDLQIVLAGPAVHANRIYLTLMSDGVRLAFAERTANDLPVFFRAAVTLSFQGCETLNKVVHEALRRRRAALEGETPNPKLARAN